MYLIMVENKAHCMTQEFLCDNARQPSCEQILLACIDEPEQHKSVFCLLYEIFISSHIEDPVLLFWVSRRDFPISE